MAKKIRKGNLKPQKVAEGEKDFAAVLEIITTHRSRALMSVNVESLLTGAFLSPRIHSGSWSRAIVGKLAEYIKRNQPELRGYGKSNLYNMALVYDTFSSDAFVSILDKYSSQLSQYRKIFQTLVGKSEMLPLQNTNETTKLVKSSAQELQPAHDFFQTAFGKRIPGILFLLSYTKLLLIAAHRNDVQEMLFYVIYSIRERLTFEELRQSLAHDAYTSLLGGDKKNYSKKLKELYPTAPVVIKDQAFLDYLALPERHRESKLRREIVSHIRDFILEMGKDFLFVDQEYTLPVGGEDFHSDLLFFHRGLQCLVAVELKTRKFRPSDMGQLEFYLEALDRDVKKENENPSIGIILCREANRIVVEYAMSRAMSPVMVAQYKRLLIPKEVLQRTFEEYLALPQNIEEDA